MKKSKLLELLVNVPHSADIRLWNGFARDWMDIEAIVPADLVKMSRAHMIEMCRIERCIDLKDWNFQFGEEELKEINEAYTKNYKWEFNDYVSLDDVKAKRYQTKKIFLIGAKLRGESSWTRAGEMSY